MNKIKVLFNINVILSSLFSIDNSGRRGIFWVAWNVLKELSKNESLEITLFSEGGNPQIIKKIREDDFLSKFKFVYKNIAVVFKNGQILPLAMKTKNIDIGYYDCYFLSNPYIDYKNNIELLENNNLKKFFILHDTMPLLDFDFVKLDFPGKLKQLFFDSYKETLNKNSYCFCTSKSCKDDFLKFYPNNLDKNNMFVSYLSTAQEFYLEKNENKIRNTLLKYKINKKPNDKYIFSFCALDIRKNLIFTIKCFIEFIEKNNIKDLYFYLGGQITDQFKEELLKNNINFEKYKDKIIFLGYVNDEDVNVLYSNSLFFTFISLYEGFGMPILEAMNCGVPVITSNVSSMPEVAGDAGIIIDPKDENSCIKSMEKLYFNKELRKELINKSLEQAKKFSWDKTCKIISDKIFEVCGNVEK